MKIKARVLGTKIDQGRMLCTIECNGKLPQKGDWITIQFGKKRSSSQNNLMWLFLEFLWRDCGLKDEYATPEELHETFKATFLSKRVFKNGMEFIKVGSTTELGKVDFGEYLDRINQAVTEYWGIDTASFWASVEENKF